MGLKKKSCARTTERRHVAPLFFKSCRLVFVVDLVFCGNAQHTKRFSNLVNVNRINDGNDDDNHDGGGDHYHRIILLIINDGFR